MSRARPRSRPDCRSRCPAKRSTGCAAPGLQAVVHAVEAIRVGYVDTMVAGGTESMSNAPYLLKGARWGYRMGNARGDRLDAARRATCAIGACHMGITAEEVAARYQRLARRPGRVRRRKSGARGACDRRRPFQGRDRRRAGAAAEGRPDSSSTPTSIRARNHRRDACRAEAGIQERRHGDRRQRVGHQRRRRRAGRYHRQEGEAARTPAAGADPRLRLDRRRSEDHGHRSGAGGAQGARARRPDDRRRSISSS